MSGEKMKNKNVFCWIFTISIVFFLLVGCSGLDEKTTLTQSPLATPDPQGPASGAGAISPLATPISDLPGWSTEPDSGKSNIRGYISITQSSVLLGELFLAKSVPTSNPDIYLLELDEQTAPRAVIDRDSYQFLFTDIEPGEYGLIVWEPMNSFPVNDPKTQQTLFFEVKAGEVVDLGILPIP